MKPDANGFELLRREIEHERELRLVSEKNAALALQLQGKEYERRLSDLNHSHQRALEKEAKYLAKDIYDINQKELQAWKENITKEMAIRTGATQANLRMWGILIVLLSTLISIFGPTFLNAIRGG